MVDRKTAVSVIVVNHNGMPYIETCLRSVFNQNYPNFEVLLVGNNSTDGSIEYVRRKFPELKLAVM